MFPTLDLRSPSLCARRHDPRARTDLGSLSFSAPWRATSCLVQFFFLLLASFKPPKQLFLSPHPPIQYDVMFPSKKSMTTRVIPANADDDDDGWWWRCFRSDLVVRHSPDIRFWELWLMMRLFCQLCCSCFRDPFLLRQLPLRVNVSSSSSFAALQNGSHCERADDAACSASC